MTVLRIDAAAVDYVPGLLIYFRDDYFVVYPIIGFIRDEPNTYFSITPERYGIR